MNFQRALSMRLSDAATLGRLRQCAGVDAGEREDQVWLRITDASEELEADLRTLPGTRFDVLPDGQLVPHGNLTPQGYLPELHWSDLRSWIQIDVSAPTLSGVSPGPTTLQVVRGGCAGEANVLLTSMETWRDYALHAAQVRLDALTFATSDDGQVVVRGTPCPPIAGVRYVEREGIAVAAGWTHRPQIDSEVMAHGLGLEAGDIAMFHADNSWDLIRDGELVRASRTAVRASTEAQGGGDERT